MRTGYGTDTIFLDGPPAAQATPGEPALTAPTIETAAAQAREAG